MPTARKELIERVGQQITDLLDPIGFRRRTQDIFTRELNAETLGWLGLNRAVHREDGALEINPMIGVRYQRLEKLVAELAGRRFHSYLPPSVAVNLGYLSRERRYVPYLFYEDDQVGEKAKAMADAIASDGYAFMEANTDLPALCQTLIQHGARDSTRYRLPVAMFLMSNKASASQYIQKELRSLGQATSPATKQYLAFAKRLEASLVDQSTT